MGRDLDKRSEEKSICSFCGRFYRSKCRYCNVHHSVPTSRGGNDNLDNLIKLQKELEHDPWHNIVTNLRVGEVARLVLNDWDTFNPNIEKHEEGADLERLERRISSWNTLFGEEASKREVLEIIITKFTKREHDKNHIKRVLADSARNGKLDIYTYLYLIRLLDNRGVE